MERSARIAGTGSFLPAHREDNFTLFERDGIRENFDVSRARGSLRGDEGVEELSPVEVFDRWARQVTGIRERRLLPEDGHQVTEDLLLEASENALEMAGMEAGDLDCIIAATLTPQETVPNPACTLAHALGVPAVGGYSLNAACAGFVYAVGAGYAFIRSGMGENVLVVSGEALSRITDYTDPKTAILFGDGAGAAVLTPTDDGDGLLGAPYQEADYAPEHLYLRSHEWLGEDDPAPKLHMGGGPKVLRQAIKAMKRVAERALEQAGLGWEGVHYVVPHQANLRITRGLERHLPLTDGKVVHTIQEYGNLSACTVAVTLDEVLRGKHGPLPSPTRVVLTAVGGGYTSAGAVLDWRPPA